MDELKICTGYRIDGKAYDYLPASTVKQQKVEAIYESMEGWAGLTKGARTWAELPPTAVKYIHRSEELIEAPVALLSPSPEREASILVHDPFTN
jgi:adenylosuccinate synthase